MTNHKKQTDNFNFFRETFLAKIQGLGGGVVSHDFLENSTVSKPPNQITK